jgi:hypothetical protein
MLYWQNGPGGPWIMDSILPDSEQVAGLPGFIQSSFRSVASNGNFEVVAPASDGGLMHWFSYLDSTGRTWRRAPDIARGGVRSQVVHLIQGNYNGNFEVIAETSDSPYGYGNLLFYWRDTASGQWYGPFPVTPV